MSPNLSKIKKEKGIYNIYDHEILDGGNACKTKRQIEMKVLEVHPTLNGFMIWVKAFKNGPSQIYGR